MFRISCLRSSALSSSIPVRAATHHIPSPRLQPRFIPSPSSSSSSSSLSSRPVPSPSRYFSSSVLRLASKKPPKSPQSLKPSSPLKPLNSSASPKPYQLSPSTLLLQALQNEGGTVVMYKGPNHRIYRIVSYTAGIACGVLIVYTLSIGLGENASVPYLTRVMMSATSIAWMLMTWMFFSGIRGLVSKVTAYTKTVPKTNQLKTELEVRVRSAIPFFRDRVYRVAPEQVRITTNIIPAKPRTALEQEAYDTMVEWLEKEDRIRRTSFFKAPLTKTSFTCHNILRNTRYAFTKELMIRMYIRTSLGDEKESIFKLDTVGEFAPAYKYLEPVILDKI